MLFKKLIVMFCLSCVAFTAESQNVELLKFDELSTIIHQKNDSLYVLNFWATWCKPCIEELPHFEKLNAEFADKGVKVILVNLDFHSRVESSVKPFLVRKNIKSRVVHITDTDPNEWISKIEEKWSGAIPATVVYKNGTTVFFKEGALTYDELKTVIDL